MESGAGGGGKEDIDALRADRTLGQGELCERLKRDRSGHLVPLEHVGQAGEAFVLDGVARQVERAYVMR